MEMTSGRLPVTFPITTQDITPYGNGVFHLNSILQPSIATPAPVVGVAICAESVVPGCGTGASHEVDIAEAARFAQAENAAGGRLSSEQDAGVRSLLADLALRDQMRESAALASRLVENAKGRVLLRPEPHKFAAFYVLRRSQVTGILFEAGYLSNPEDEAMLMTVDGRKPIVDALARSIEIEAAIVRAR